MPILTKPDKVASLMEEEIIYSPLTPHHFRHFPLTQLHTHTPLVSKILDTYNEDFLFFFYLGAERERQ